MTTGRYSAHLLATTLLIAALALPAGAQPDRDWQERFGRPGAASNWIEYEVVGVAKKDFTVTARDVETGQQLTFKVPPDSFVGQRFTADFSGARQGDRVSVHGLPDAKLDNLKTAPGGRGDAPGRPGRPGSGDATRRPGGGPPGDLADRGRARHEYRITAVDSRTMTLTAVSDTGGEVKLEVDPDAFEGYRFRTRTGDVQEGKSFSLLALNQTPIASCCTLVSGPGR
ncbi:MAG: hypothetical protein R3325_03425 [Thermoanaerobaculia bacterium]|nr:hypothetical protein [Thermoanaerobaculia bacterium]